MKKRLLIVDEAWYMMRYPDSAAFLQGIAKRARKYFLGVTTLTQDIEDFLSSDYGKAILSNSSVQILLKQGSSEVETLAKTLNLSEGEKQYLLTAQVGEGLLFAGQNHVTAQFVASQFEYDLVTSRPQDTMQNEPQAPEPPTEPPAPSAPTSPLDVPSTEAANPFTMPQQPPAMAPGMTPVAQSGTPIPQQPAPLAQASTPSTPTGSTPPPPTNPLNTGAPASGNKLSSWH
jgi:hypothetical protein